MAMANKKDCLDEGTTCQNCGETVMPILAKVNGKKVLRCPMCHEIMDKKFPKE